MRFAVSPHLKGKPATITELILALPDEDFVAMRQDNQRLLAIARAEVARLEVEAQQLKEAAEAQNTDSEREARDV